MLTIISGATALGLLWAIATIGVYISYRVLDVADLTVEGSIVLGAAVASTLIANGTSPLLATLTAVLAGALAGLASALLHTKLKIPALLAGILCMIALYSVNIRVMHKSANVSLLRKETLLSFADGLGFTKNGATILLGGLCCIGVILLIRLFLKTEIGFAVRATGGNGKMATAQGIDVDTMTILGLMLSNALVGLSGALIAQYQGFADVQMGQGAIVIGLASLFIGEVLFGRTGILRSLVAVSLGAVVYRMIIALVIELGMLATDLKLFTAITVAAALYLPVAKKQIAQKNVQRRERHVETDEPAKGV